MQKEAINEIIESELRHITLGDIGSLQSHLRFYYYDIRRDDLIKKNPRGRGVILKKAITQLKKRKSCFVPNYDENFFK